jgi:hypothetical protein
MRRSPAATGSALAFYFFLFITNFLSAQSGPPAQRSAEGGGNTENLQKATQNPVASLVSVPLQDNSNFGICYEPCS